MPTKKPATPRYSFKVDEAFIKEAYASACQEWKDKIRAQFPDLFKPEPFEFGDSYKIGTDSSTKGPLYIGRIHVPAGRTDLELKCLVVNPAYDLKVTERRAGQKVLIFESVK